MVVRGLLDEGSVLDGAYEEKPEAAGWERVPKEMISAGGTAERPSRKGTFR
jgi:hypothetical protein